MKENSNYIWLYFKGGLQLEMRIFQRDDELNHGQISHRWNSGVKLKNFYGIELADFAAETAKLSLWIAEYQMNQRFKRIFGEAPPDFPLKEGGHVMHGNALRLDWVEVCPAPDDKEVETYIVGNPPYLGGKLQNEYQKRDIALSLQDWGNFKNLDYVVGWFKKGSDYIAEKGGTYAFVSTNSVNQGVQVPNVWPHIFSAGQEISFAHRNFSWSNNASNRAKVICSIIGIRNKEKSPKFLFDKSKRRKVSNISAYLLDGSDIVVEKCSKSISGLPMMMAGNTAYDGGEFLLSAFEKEQLITSEPTAKNFLRRVVGSKEFLNGIERYCIWISDHDKSRAYKIDEIAKRIDGVRLFRVNGGNAAQSCAHRPHQFCLTRTAVESQLTL